MKEQIFKSYHDPWKVGVEVVQVPRVPSVDQGVVVDSARGHVRGVVLEVNDNLVVLRVVLRVDKIWTVANSSPFCGITVSAHGAHPKQRVFDDDNGQHIRLVDVSC